MKAYVAMGCNLGDRLENMNRALKALRRRDIRAVRASPVYETDPVGPPQPDYLNAVVEVETDLEPLQLLGALKQAEQQSGRKHRERWGPREIDLDIVLYEDLSLNADGLEIPHPHLTERAFVLVPLLDLDPQATLPDGRKLAVFLTDRTGVRAFEGHLVLPA